MSNVMNKVAAYVYECAQEMEKDTTSIQAVRNATAHSIRGIRALGEAAGVSRSAIKPLVNTRLYKAEKMMGLGTDRLRMVRDSALPVKPDNFLGAQNLRDIAAFRGKPQTALKTIENTGDQMARMRGIKNIEVGNTVSGRNLQMPRIENTQRITGPNMREKFKLLNY